MPLVDAVAGSAGVVLAVLHILLWVQVAGPSGVDVTNILIKVEGNASMSLLRDISSEDCQWLCYVSKILDELVVVTNKSQKWSYLFSCFGGS